MSVGFLGFAVLWVKAAVLRVAAYYRGSPGQETEKENVVLFGALRGILPVEREEKAGPLRTFGSRSSSMEFL
jgi:hypothetical protein